jgi:DNA-binding winged helix-turn-helix (wHTH) protein
VSRTFFDRFTLDSAERRLFDGGEEIRLGPKAFSLLSLLIDERPKALSKDEILQRLWPGTFVTENNLATLVSDLRTALHDDVRQPKFIRTVYAFGYAFVASASTRAASAATGDRSGWKLIHAQREIHLQPGVNVIGRSGDRVIVLDSPTISREHAQLSISGDRATVADLGSKNGTWIGTKPVTGAVPVNDGDELRLGSVVVVVRFSPAALSTETVAQAGS